MPWTADFNQSGFGLAGSVEQMIERIRHWAELGIDYITLSNPQNDEQTKHLLAEKILPTFSE
jgi:alkanesulfonate monooxygenase SsuD/methylene tetrahydromethanopterin reductase-like flavin-dependent oxidoreductase (luciferase family)